MWPKVLTQLIELLPHASRLLPLAEKYFQGKGEVTARLDEESRAVLQQSRTSVDALSEELSKRAGAQEALTLQVKEQGAQLASAVEETRASREAVEAMHVRLAAMEKRLAAVATGVSVALVMLLIVVVFVLVLFFHGVMGAHR